MILSFIPFSSTATLKSLLTPLRSYVIRVMSEVRFNGKIKRAVMHTEVTVPNDRIWISGFESWKKLSRHDSESDLSNITARAISHESLHLALRSRIGLRASKTLDHIFKNDLLSVDNCGLNCLDNRLLVDVSKVPS